MHGGRSDSLRAESDARRTSGAVLAGGGCCLVLLIAQCCAACSCRSSSACARLLPQSAARLALGRAGAAALGVGHSSLAAFGCLIVIGAHLPRAAAAHPGAADSRRCPTRSRGCAPWSRRGRASSSAPTIRISKPSDARSQTIAGHAGRGRLRRAVVWSQGRGCSTSSRSCWSRRSSFFYVLIDWHPMLAQDRYLAAARPRRPSAASPRKSTRVSAFIRGQGTVCLVLAIYYALALGAAGLRYGLLVGSLPAS